MNVLYILHLKMNVCSLKEAYIPFLTELALVCLKFIFPVMGTISLTETTVTVFLRQNNPCYFYHTITHLPVQVSIGIGTSSNVQIMVPFYLKMFYYSIKGYKYHY